jgi:hypothetical protein
MRKERRREGGAAVIKSKYKPPPFLRISYRWWSQRPERILLPWQLLLRLLETVAAC